MTLNADRLEASHETTSVRRLQELANQSSELTRQVAANPNAPPELLRELSSSEDAIVREAVAGNPNTPTEILLKLAGEFPEAFLDNPVFPLLCLEYPDFINIIPTKSTNRLLQCPKAPTSLLERASVRVRAALAGDRQTSVTILTKLADDENSWVRERVGAHPKTPPMVLDSLASDEHYRVRKLVASNPHTPISTLERLAGDEEIVRLGVTTHPQTPETVLERLANDPNQYVRLGVATHPRTPETVLKGLAGDRDRCIRAAVAKHPQIPAHLRAIDDAQDRSNSS